jgi:hypothetical protein
LRGMGRVAASGECGRVSRETTGAALRERERELVGAESARRGESVRRALGPGDLQRGLELTVEEREDLCGSAAGANRGLS